MTVSLGKKSHAPTPAPAAAPALTPAHRPSAVPVHNPLDQTLAVQESVGAAGARVAGGKFVIGGLNPLAAGGKILNSNVRKTSLFLIIAGRTGTGKNTLAYSAAQEGQVVDLSIVERGSMGNGKIVEYIDTGHIIQKALMPEPADMASKDVSARLWDEAQKFIYGMYGFKGTLIVNTLDELYEVGRVAINSRLDKVMARDYGPINRAMAEMLGLYARDNCVTNLILIAKGKDKYVNDINTGEMTPGGWAGAQALADGIVYTLKKEISTVKAGVATQAGKSMRPEDLLCGVVAKCPGDITQEHKIIHANDLTFLNLKKVML